MNVGMGLSLSTADFSRVLQARKPALVGLGSLIILVPGVGFAIAHAFSLPPEIAVGIVLVATCPGGMFSNLMTDYARGTLALSVTLTAVSSAIYIFTIPAWVDLALRVFTLPGADVGLPFAEVLAPLLLFVLTPIAIGMFVRARAPNWAEAHMGKVKNVAALIVLLIMIYIAASQPSDTIADLPRIVAAVLILNLASVAIAAIASRLTRLSGPDSVAVVMEHAVRQEGTGIYIAATLIGSPAMALPLLLNSGVGMLFALAVVAYKRRRRPSAA